MQTLNLVQSQLVENKSYESYLSTIESDVKRFYRDNLNLIQFIDRMVLTVEGNLIDAWNSGASECGFRTEEFNRNDLLIRDRYIDNQLQYVYNYGQSIRLDRNNVRIGEALQRARMWANRWWEMQALANQTMCADLKKMWRWNPYKEHCTDCRKMNGRVYRNSVWAAYGIRPGSASLACFGGECGCQFVNTSKRITPGRPPALVGPRG